MFESTLVYSSPLAGVSIHSTSLQVEGMPDEVVFDHLHSTAFQYSPLGRTILGPASNIQKLTRQDLSDYIATHYTTPRMVRHMQFLGGFNIAAAVALVHCCVSWPICASLSLLFDSMIKAGVLPTYACLMSTAAC